MPPKKAEKVPKASAEDGEFLLTPKVLSYLLSFISI